MTVTMTFRLGGAEIVVTDDTVSAEPTNTQTPTQSAEPTSPTKAERRPKAAPKPKASQPKTSPKATKRTTKPTDRSPKASGKASNKELLAQIRELRSRGELEKALEITPSGWVQEWQAIAKAMVGSQEPKAAQEPTRTKRTKSAKPTQRKRSPRDRSPKGNGKGTKRAKTDVESARRAETPTSEAAKLAMGQPQPEPKARTSQERHEAAERLMVPEPPKVVSTQSTRERAEAIVGKAMLVAAEGSADRIADAWAHAQEALEAIDLKIDDEPTNDRWKILGNAYAEAVTILAETQSVSA